MDLGRLVPVVLRNAAEQNIQPTQEALASLHQLGSRVGERVEGKHETQAVLSEKAPPGGSEEQYDGSNPHEDFGSLHPLGRGETRDFTDERESRQTDVKDRPFRSNIRDRIAHTMTNAKEEKDKHATRAMWSGYILNAAIGLQVLAGALTTAIAAGTSGPQSSKAVSALGGLTTVVASYLARVRGSGEPELSITRVKDLEQFLRDTESFVMDHGDEYGAPGDKLDKHINDLRKRFELLLGNSAKGEDYSKQAPLKKVQAP